MALNSLETINLPSIILSKHVGNQLDAEAQVIFITSFQLSRKMYDPNAVLGSEYLVAGLVQSGEAVDYLRTFGISREEMLRVSGTLEKSVPGSNESHGFRSVFSLASILAHQERSLQRATLPTPEFQTNDYRIGGKHIVDAIRRTPSSGAYRVLRELTEHPTF